MKPIDLDFFPSSQRENKMYFEISYSLYSQFNLFPFSFSIRTNICFIHFVLVCHHQFVHKCIVFGFSCFSFSLHFYFSIVDTTILYIYFTPFFFIFLESIFIVHLTSSVKIKHFSHAIGLAYIYKMGNHSFIQNHFSVHRHYFLFLSLFLSPFLSSSSQCFYFCIIYTYSMRETICYFDAHIKWRAFVFFLVSVSLLPVYSFFCKINPFSMQSKIFIYHQYSSMKLKLFQFIFHKLSETDCFSVENPI